ncbi:MAG: hypothetical protein H0Z38_09040 [Firmicutes bacterium]|nr:hypothetical protein [Bacillota bacterium]
MSIQDKLTRREFLIGASGFTAGAAVGATLGGSVFDILPAKAAGNELPWPYVKLDPEVARIRGYEMTREGH